MGPPPRATMRRIAARRKRRVARLLSSPSLVDHDRDRDDLARRDEDVALAGDPGAAVVGLPPQRPAPCSERLGLGLAGVLAGKADPPAAARPSKEREVLGGPLAADALDVPPEREHGTLAVAVDDGHAERSGAMRRD